MPRRPSRRPVSGISMALVAGLAVAGCTQHLTLRKHALPDGAVPPLIVSESVSVEAGRVDQTGRAYDVGWYDLAINYREFTEAAVRDLVQELQRQDIRVVADGGRRIELTVMYVDLVHKFGAFDCLIDYRVTTGDGAPSGLQARASGANPRAACSAAVPGVAVATLKDPKIVAYLAGTPQAAEQ